MNYYIASGDQQKGPFTPEQLAEQGVRADTLVWAEGMSEWQRADHIPSLWAVLAPTAAPVQPSAPMSAPQPFAQQQQVWQQGYPSQAPGAPVGFGPVGGYPPTPAYGAAPGYPMAPNYGLPMTYADPNLQTINGKKMSAGLCALILGLLGFGGFGIHKFILGQTSAGVIMLLISLVGGIATCGVSTLVMSIIALIEGIIYLTKTDEQFYQEYFVHKKQWF